MSATQEREQQLVRGTVTSLLVKGNDSWQVVVRPDNSQYDKKLWTKEATLIGELNQRGIGQRFDFLCNASYWTNNQNQQVRSLWVEAVAQYGTLQDPAPPVQTSVSGLPGMGLPLPGAPMPGTGLPQPPVGGPLPGMPQQQQQQGPLPQTQPEAYDPPIPHSVKEMRILRQTGMKCACIMQSYIPEHQRGSMAGLQQMSEWFVRYFMGGPQDVPGEGFPQQPLPVAGVGHGSEDETPPDWVTQDGPVAQDYTAGQPAQPYAGGFPQ